MDASGNGRNYSGNQFTLDGLNITSNILQGTANLTPNPDSVQEVAVQTNTFNVEHGQRQLGSSRHHNQGGIEPVPWDSKLFLQR